MTRAKSMDYAERFRIAPEARTKLERVDAGYKDPEINESQAASVLDADTKRLRELQNVLYAEHARSLLICLQGMDTSGKDGTVSHIFGAMNPQGCRAVAFKAPSAEELSHDFLWRIHRAVPAKGEVVIFNRSHYEDVLVARVHKLVSKSTWSRRYEQINAFEEELAAEGTHILKFFLHISKQEQLKRFKARLDDPSKQWKISEADYAERKYWDDYVDAYDDALSRCSTKHAPWFVIPSDHKWFRNLAIARIVVATLEGLKMHYPKPTVDLDRIRREYHAAKRG
jgi:PPK2 family polyphosphate:nucleotide phosphotransferase